MAKKTVIDESDKKLLQDLLDWARRQVPHRRQHIPEPDGYTPEVYIIRTPTAGIPALSGLTPGSVECSIYRVISDTLELTDVTQVVYNVGAFIGGNQWVVVVRDKYGTWFALYSFTSTSFCISIADQCTGTTRYLRQSAGLLTVSNVPCDECTDITTGTGTLLSTVCCGDTISDGPICVELFNATAGYEYLEGSETLPLLAYYPGSQVNWGTDAYGGDHGTSGYYALDFYCATSTSPPGFKLDGLPNLSSVSIRDYDGRTPTSCSPFLMSGQADIIDSTGATVGTIDYVVTSGECEGTPPTSFPTVTQNLNDIDTTALTIGSVFTIAGTGFDTTAANNFVTFSLGLLASCTTATTTLLTMTVVSAPSGTGALTAIVDNPYGSSTPAVQVRTVVSGSTPTTSWQDTFTDTDLHDLATHTPDVGSGGYAETIGAPRIISNQYQAVIFSGGGFIGNEAQVKFNPGTVHNTVTMKMLLFLADGTDFVVVAVRFDGTDDGILVYVDGTQLQIYDLTAGVKTPQGTASTLTLTPNTEYTLTITDTGSVVTAVINSVSLGMTTSTGNTRTQMGLSLGAASSPDGSYVDTLLVTGL